MAIRIRKNGKILCAALNKAEKGDVYLNDSSHYRLSVIEKLLVTQEEPKHSNTGGEWWWKDEKPDNIKIK